MDHGFIMEDAEETSNEMKLVRRLDRGWRRGSVALAALFSVSQI